MATSAQDMIDRRRLRRKLGFWRAAAVVCLALALIGVPLALHLSGKGMVPLGDQIARVSIEGLITEDDKLLELLEDLRKDPGVKAIILKIDSPGGTTVGGETLYRAARELAVAKPVAAEIGTLAASAGYMVAIAADHIVAHDTSIVGSIGVLFQYVDASKLLNTVGVTVAAIKSAPMKAEPSPFNPASDDTKAMIGRLVMDTFDWFVGLVGERRPIGLDGARKLADGSVFTGRQSLQNRLVDALGGEDEVRAWLEKERGVAPGLKIVDRKPKKDEDGWSVFAEARASLFATLGLDPAARSLPEALGRKAGRLDGLVSLWQPSVVDGGLR